MTIEVSVERLKELHACQEGIDAFKGTFGDGTSVLSWTPMHQAVLLGGCLSQYWGWAVFVGLIPAWSMTEWRLDNADLSGANLRDADLRDANLRDAKGLQV